MRYGRRRRLRYVAAAVPLTPAADGIAGIRADP